MALDLTKFCCWFTSHATNADTGEEGIKPSEKSLDDTLVVTLTGATVETWSIPIPASTVIASGTKFYVSVRGIRSGGTNAGAVCTLKVDGSSVGTVTLGPYQSSAVTITGTITISSPVTVSATVTLEITRETSSWGGDLSLYYYHDDMHVGMDSTGSAAVARTRTISNRALAAASHASPTVKPFDMRCDLGFDVRRGLRGGYVRGPALHRHADHRDARSDTGDRGGRGSGR